MKRIIMKTKKIINYTLIGFSNFEQGRALYSFYNVVLFPLRMLLKWHKSGPKVLYNPFINLKEIILHKKLFKFTFRRIVFISFPHYLLFIFII